MEKDVRVKYNEELAVYLLGLEKKAQELNDIVSELRSAHRNLFATSEVDISGTDEESKWISRLDYAKRIRKQAETFKW